MATVTVSLPNTTFVSSRNSGSNYSYYPLLYSGVDPSFGTCIGYLNISLPDLPVSVVDSARLRFSVIVKSGNDPSPIAVYRATEPFNTNSVTYLSQPATVPTTSAVNVTAADLYQTVEIDITTLVNQWIGGTYPNDGIALVNTDGTTLVEFATNAISYPPYYPQLVITYSSSPVGPSTATNFCLSQLANVLQQFITFYPSTSMTAYTKGFTSSSVTGIPVSITLSPDGTYGGLLILKNGQNNQMVPLNSITAFTGSDGSVYNPNFTYLTAPNFAEGADKYIVTGIHDSLSVSDYVSITTGTVITVTGYILKNPYGIIVMVDGSGNNPAFLPVTGGINAIFPTSDNGIRSSLPQITVGKPEDTPTPQPED